MTKFWTLASGSVKIEPEALHTFLKEDGVFVFQPNGINTKILVRFNGNRVRQVGHDEIRRICWDYLMDESTFTNPEERKMVKNEFHRSGSFFTYRNLLLLEKAEVNEVKDTKESGYLFFNNCFLEITPDSIVRKDYMELKGHVWEDDVLKFDLASAPGGNYAPSGEFHDFLNDICKHDQRAVQQQNHDSLITILGYLLHRYKDPALAKAIIFMDTYIDGNANGGTGKGLMTKSLDKVRKTAFQDGKYFSSRDKFTYSNVSYGTRILVYDDVPRDFDFERIFPLVTEKAVVERKYENKFEIPFEESPKVLITTNYTVEGSGSSHRRRKLEFIFSPTYSDTFSPEDRFGHLMFIEWDQSEWENFYHLMAYCLQMYLLEGLITPRFNVAERTLKMNATKEFIKFANTLEIQVKYDKKELYEKFLSTYPGHSKLEQNSFTRCMKLFAEAYGFEMVETHSGDYNYFELIIIKDEKNETEIP